MLARWQLTVFCVVLLGLYFVRNFNRYAVAAALLFAVSVSYFLMMDFLRPVLESAEASTALYTEGSGLFERLNDLQNDGLYFLVAPVKAAHLLFSLGFKIDGIQNPIVVYNDQIVATYCLVNMLLFASLVATRRLTLKNDLIAISVVYLIVFALTPIYAPRYFYPVTVIWALALANVKSGLLPVRSPQVAILSK